VGTSHATQAVTKVLWRRLQEGGFIVFSALAIFLFVSLITYSDTDAAWSQSGTYDTLKNAAGGAGAWFADLFLYLFGIIAYLFPIMIGYSGVRLCQNRLNEYYVLEKSSSHRLLWILRMTGFGTALLAGSGLANLHIGLEMGMPMGAGGVLGRIVSTQLLPACGYLGTSLLLLAFFLAGITLTTGLSWFGLMDWVSKRLFNKMQGLVLKWPDIWMFIKEKCSSRFKTAPMMNINPNLAKPKRIAPSMEPREPMEVLDMPIPITGTLMPIVVPRIEMRTQTRPLKKLYPVRTNTALPAVSLLEEASEEELVIRSQSFSHAKLEVISREVEARLLEFGIQVTVVSVFPGPVITRFEMELAAGIKVSKITTLAKDLARALSVTKVRVVEVIPGKSVVGLELPNENRELVRFREIVESAAYIESTSPLTLALGKDISGAPTVVNLAKMPHLLVAGTTGSGKSVGVNAMLLSLLYKSTPMDVRLILIDPKMLELSIYDGIPHLLTPVVTDMKDAANALKWCVGEMEKRYQLMAAVGVRNLLGYNRKVEEAEEEGQPLYNPLWKPEHGGERPVLNRLPYIVVIIDEFADMIMVVGKKVEELIARIAQKARAAGIHMILATQRPSVDVITGLIKANVPTRIAYQVSCRIDSRTILDQQGAEQLLGHGDMLYLPPGTGIPMRIHGAFVSDEEVHAVVKALKQMGEPDYAEDILSGSSLSGTGAYPGFESEEEGEQDELYDEAVHIVTDTRRTSISHLQRRLKIGYNRAARLIETMEAAGVVSPLQSSGTREVLAPSPITD
jgi:S-DNA-T family DNA segregation ATPase FtsK/SpoIIIE